MSDLFDETIVCKDCNRKMLKSAVSKNGFRLRILECSKCKKRIYHPADLEEYKRFLGLKQKPFNVKLRLVGNSWTVSIPKEIINFHQQLRREMKEHITKMSKIVKLCLEEPWRLSLLFGEEDGN